MKFVFLGELMLRLCPAKDGERLDSASLLRTSPGGSEANTAVALQSLGGNQTFFITSLPRNPLGEQCLRILRANQVTPVNLPSGKNRMGLYWVEKGMGPRPSKVYYDRDDSSFDHILVDSLTKDHFVADWFHSSGITPGISERTSLALDRCLSLLPETTPFSLDLNFRNKLWGWANQEKMHAVYNSLCLRAQLITGNESDFENCLGIKGSGGNQVEVYTSIAKKVFSRFNRVRYMAVSLRNSFSATRNGWSGMIFVRNETGLDFYSGPEVEIDSIVDRLGTGDAFTAGILHGLASFGNNFQKVVNFAVMLAALKHSVQGDFANFSEAEVLQVLESEGNGAIRR